MKNSKNSLVAFFWGLTTSVSSLFKPKATPDDMKKIGFSASTQKMGVRFTAKIRDIFRRKWVRKV